MNPSSVNSSEEPTTSAGSTSTTLTWSIEYHPVTEGLSSEGEDTDLEDEDEAAKKEGETAGEPSSPSVEKEGTSLGEQAVETGEGSGDSPSVEKAGTSQAVKTGDGSGGPPPVKQEEGLASSGGPPPVGKEGASSGGPPSVEKEGASSGGPPPVEKEGASSGGPVEKDASPSASVGEPSGKRPGKKAKPSKGGESDDEEPPCKKMRNAEPDAREIPLKSRRKLTERPSKGQVPKKFHGSADELQALIANRDPGQITTPFGSPYQFTDSDNRLLKNPTARLMETKIRVTNQFMVLHMAQFERAAYIELMRLTNFGLFGIVAGGYVSYLSGLTNTYTDIDFFCDDLDTLIWYLATASKYDVTLTRNIDGSDLMLVCSHQPSILQIIYRANEFNSRIQYYDAILRNFDQPSCRRGFFVCPLDSKDRMERNLGEYTMEVHYPGPCANKLSEVRKQKYKDRHVCHPVPSLQELGQQQVRTNTNLYTVRRVGLAYGTVECQSAKIVMADGDPGPSANELFRKLPKRDDPNWPRYRSTRSNTTRWSPVGRRVHTLRDFLKGNPVLGEQFAEVQNPIAM